MRAAERDHVVAEMRERLLRRQQRGTGALVETPRPRGRHVHGGIRIDQPSMVARQKIAALRGGQEACELVPRLWEHVAEAVQKPVDFARAAEEDSAQHEPEHARRMRLGVRKRERRTPGSAEDEPARDAEVLAEPLEVGDEMRRRVVAQLAERRRAPCPALVVDDDSVGSRVEEPPMPGRRAGAGSAVQEDDGNPLRAARGFPVRGVHPVEPEHAARIRLDFGIQRRDRLRCSVAHWTGLRPRVTAAARALREAEPSSRSSFATRGRGGLAQRPSSNNAGRSRSSLSPQSPRRRGPGRWRRGPRASPCS